jgi:signal peptidase I
MTDPTERRRRRSGWMMLRRWMVRSLAIVGLFFIIFHTCFSLDQIHSSSMAPTLIGEGHEGGDWVLVEKISYWFRKPRRWEVVRFVHRDGFDVMKRVAGLPGETFGIEGYRVQINGQELPLPPGLEHLKYYSYGHVGKDRTYKNDDGYFVLGDDSKDSMDSRYDGPLPAKRIMGRAWLIIWPPERMRFITP